LTGSHDRRATFSIRSRRSPIAARESGITLYDYVTGEPYCARMLAGELVHAKGACATVAARTTVVAPPATDKSDTQ
jgi:hypothetical protein